MMRRLMSLAILPLALTACTPADQGPTFKSEKERGCYQKARAEITDGNVTLERDKEGVFVQVKRVSGFVSNIEPSVTFERCMVTATQPEVGPEVKDMAISLTAAEKAQWDKLSDSDRKAALIYIQSGGTLESYLAQLKT